MEADKKIVQNVKKGFRLFLIITVVSIIIILIFTVRKNTLYSLKQVNLLFLCMTTAICLFRIYLECLRLQTLTWAFGNRISLRSSAEFTVGGYFLSLTPFGVGGLPLQFYILMRDRFSLGESGAIIGTRGLTFLFAFVVGMPILIGYRSLFASTGIKMLSSYLVAIYGILFVLFILVMWRTERVKYRLSWFKKFFIRRGYQKAITVLDKLIDEIDKFKFGFKKCCSSGISKLIITIFLSCLSLFFYTLIAPFLFRSLGIQCPILMTAIIQLILTFLLMFAPTPGSSGIAEGVGFALYRSICVKPELLGIYVILWRFFTYYIGVILGGFIILRMLAVRGKRVEVNQ
ncbi:MAG: lysylphosphatidylglycerol synthase transmembrane domain-containing protein [bacterium]|nr:lysylphosphatidylglycerol synthase transmembrane domain-containing protein [bacterium]